jgi:hypothetical protein
MNAFKSLFLGCLLATTLAGCDQLGIETADKVAARLEADGKAIGGACRYSGRALEDCYDLNRRASKAAVYAGWRDMDAYMRENNIAVVKPTQSEETAPAKAENAAAGGGDSPKKSTEASADKPTEDKLSGTAHGDKPAKAATKTS